MISIDANLLIAAMERSHAAHAEARAFVSSLEAHESVAISELCLVELYGLLRNPAVCSRPLEPAQAVSVCQAFRRHPTWRLLGFPSESVAVHDALWAGAGQAGFARRRIYDLRLALVLLQQGVTDFATANVKDFQGLGFRRVWNPLPAA